MSKRLETVEAVVEALYGRGADMARALGRSRSSIWKYVQRDQLPGEMYDDLQSTAKRHGFVIADELFTTVTVHPRLLNRS